MNREDIIRMAREAGFERLGHTDNDWVCYPEDIERFAALVASAEREETERLRALCQKMLSELFVYRASENLKDVTAAIRARGQA